MLLESWQKGGGRDEHLSCQLPVAGPTYFSDNSVVGHSTLLKRTIIEFFIGPAFFDSVQIIIIKGLKHIWEIKNVAHFFHSEFF
jgi:hypothetical protein